MHLCSACNRRITNALDDNDDDDDVQLALDFHADQFF